MADGVADTESVDVLVGELVELRVVTTEGDIDPGSVALADQLIVAVEDPVEEPDAKAEALARTVEDVVGVERDEDVARGLCDGDENAVGEGDDVSVDAADPDESGDGELAAVGEPDEESDTYVAAAEIVTSLERTVADGVVVAAVADCSEVNDAYEVDDVGEAEDEPVTAGEAVEVCDPEMVAVPVIVVDFSEDCVLVAEPEVDVDDVKVDVEQPLGVEVSERIAVIVAELVPEPDNEAVGELVALNNADSDPVEDDVVETEELAVGDDDPDSVIRDDALPVAVTV